MSWAQYIIMRARHPLPGVCVEHLNCVREPWRLFRHMYVPGILPRAALGRTCFCCRKRHESQKHYIDNAWRSKVFVEKSPPDYPFGFRRLESAAYSWSDGCVEYYYMATAVSCCVCHFHLRGLTRRRHRYTTTLLFTWYISMPFSKAYQVYMGITPTEPSAREHRRR